MRRLSVLIVISLAWATAMGSQVNGTHLYWYQALTNGYDLQASPGPALPQDIIVHEGKVLSCNNAPGLGFQGGGFSCGSNINDDQGFCGAAFFTDLCNPANANGHVDSAFICGELSDYWSGNGPLCNGGSIALRCGAADISFGIMMWGDASSIPTDARWADLDPMSTLDYSLAFAGGEEIITLSTPAGRPTGNTDAPVLDSHFIRINVTTQVNWILQNISGGAYYAIACLAPIGQGSTGKFSTNANESCTGTPADSTITVPNQYWSQDGNTLHLVCYGTLDDAVGTERGKGAQNAVCMTVTPNPFNPETRISINTGGQGLGATPAKILAYNFSGKVVDQLTVSGHELAAGVSWNASQLPSGIYILRATIGGQVYSKRVTLIK